MKALTDLYNTIQNENIYLGDHYMSQHKAATINIKNDFMIFVDYRKIETLNDEFNAVSHEYGHCATGTTHKLYSRLELISRHEYRADRCAVNKFLPFDKLSEALNKGIVEYSELSEYFDLPEEFVKKAIQHYTDEGLLCR